jgi:hypothetical protein
MLRRISLVLVVAALTTAAYGYQITSSKIDSWELTFSSKPPRVLEVVENEKRVEYTYVVYDVANKTTQEVDFYPCFQVETDGGKVYTAGAWPSVEERIAERFGKDILGCRDMVGAMKPGETRRGVAIFKRIDPAADRLTLYVSGLTGDYKMEPDAEGKAVARYRTLKAVFYRPGDEWAETIDPVTRETTEWVWRG